MQSLGIDPTVRIRELKHDRVDFVLENVDLAYGDNLPIAVLSILSLVQVCKLVPASNDGGRTYCWYDHGETMLLSEIYG
jgi:hypothetical protein